MAKRVAPDKSARTAAWSQRLSCKSRDHIRPFKGCGEVPGHFEKLPINGDKGFRRYPHVVADQRGIDVVLSLFAPDGSKLLDIDSPNGSKGPEAFWTIGKDAGNYTVQISSPEAADEPGKYEVLVEDIQPVTPDLRSFSQAQDLMREGMMIKSGKAADKTELAKAKILAAAELIDQIQFDKQKKAAGLAQVGKAFAQLKMSDEARKYGDRAAAVYEELGLKREQMMVLVESQEQALTELDLISRNEKIRKLAIELGDKKTEASALIQIGTGYYDLGDFSHSIMVVQQALQIGIETGDKARMDAAYDNLGAFYTAQGNFAAALESHQKAVAIQYTIRNKQPKATTILNIGNVYEGLGNY